MIQIAPQEAFPIVRQLSDPSNLTGQYVRAVIRNAGNGAILKVGANNYLNLTDRGSGRFSANWEALVADGTFVDITTSVYSDSGYTTLSTVYGIENETYLVKTRWGIEYIQAGGGGVAKVDYEKLKAVIQEVIDSQEIELPENDLTPILLHLDKIHNSVKKIQIPEQKPIDLSPVLESLDKVHGMIRKLPPATPVTDLTKVHEGISTLTKHIQEVPTKVKTDHDEVKRELLSAIETFKTTLETLKNEVQGTKFHFMVEPSRDKPQPSIKEDRVKSLLS